MSEGRKPGRPRKEGFVLVKIKVPTSTREYLDRVQSVQRLPDRSAAGELVLTDAANHNRFLDIDATIATEFGK